MVCRKAPRGLAAVDPRRRSSEIVHHETVIIPYAMNDTTTCVSTVPLDALLGHIIGRSSARRQNVST